MKVHVARQPIFDKEKKVVGYKLLFRNGTDNYFPGTDGDQATADVINSSFFLKITDDLTGGKKAYINFTHSMIKHQLMTIIPSDAVAVDVTDMVASDAEFLDACRQIRQKGYTIVIAHSKTAEAFLELADIVKVDFTKTKEEERRSLATRLTTLGVELLADKVESFHDFEQAKELGFKYFQGYFFGRPEMFSGRDVPGYSVNYLNMLRESSRAEIDFDKLEQILRRDVALSFKLLKFINLSFPGAHTKISSVKQALVLLGRQDILKWISLLALQNITQEKPNELVIWSLIRARLAELMAFQAGWTQRSNQAFLCGLFSMVDAMLDRPLEDILKELPLNDDIVTALLQGDNDLGHLQKMILHYEKGEWDEFSVTANELGIGENDVAELYQQALEWEKGQFAMLA